MIMCSVHEGHGSSSTTGAASGGVSFVLVILTCVLICFCGGKYLRQREHTSVTTTRTVNRASRAVSKQTVKQAVVLEESIFAVVRY